MTAPGAEQKHVTLPTDFRSLPETGHSRYGDPTGRVCPIVFSNGSMGSGSFLSGIGAFGCLRSLRAHLALDGVSWVQSGSVEIAVGRKPRATESAPSSAPSLGVAPLGSSVGPPSR
jgi:hypothetical protein